MKTIYAVVMEYFDVDNNVGRSFVSEIFNDLESAVKYVEEREYEQKDESDDDLGYAWESKEVVDHEDDETLIWRCYIEKRVYSF